MGFDDDQPHVKQSHHIKSHHIVSYHTTSHQFTPHLITPHYITSHHITSHHFRLDSMTYAKLLERVFIGHFEQFEHTRGVLLPQRVAEGGPAVGIGDERVKAVREQHP